MGTGNDGDVCDSSGHFSFILSLQVGCSSEGRYHFFPCLQRCRLIEVSLALAIELSRDFGGGPLLGHVFAVLPQVARGTPFVLNGDPKGKNFLYTSGNSVIIRDIKARNSSRSRDSLKIASLEPRNSRNVHGAQNSGDGGRLRSFRLLHRFRW